MQKYQGNLHRLLVILFILSVFGCQTVETPVTPEINNHLDRFDKAAEIIFQEYVDPIPAQKLLVWSIDGIQKDFDSRGLIEDEDDRSLGRNNRLDYDLKSSHDMEDVKSNFRSLFIHSSRTFSDFSSHDFVDSAIKGMIAHLDPQCALLSPDDLQKIKTDTKGKFTGLGMVITMKDGLVTAMFSIKGTPAYRAGIVAGDQIHRVNGIEVLNVWDAVRRARGAEGERITLTVDRKNRKNPVVYEIVREVIPNKSVYTRMLRSGFGYAWIGSFDENTAADLETALAGLDTENRPLRGLILDLRDNRGGLLGQAIRVSDLFMENGNIVSVKGRIKRNSREFKANPNITRRSYPMVVLINKGSASAAEIVASALQENNRAIVLGETSFGKGSIQAVDGIGDGYGIKMTIARYYTPKGKLIQGRGVVPDVFVSHKIASRFRTVLSDESGLMDDPAIDIALLAMARANSSDFYDLRSVARNVTKEKKIGLEIDENTPMESENNRVRSKNHSSGNQGYGVQII